MSKGNPDAEGPGEKRPDTGWPDEASPGAEGPSAEGPDAECDLRCAQQLARPVDARIAKCAQHLARAITAEGECAAVLFYGSNLRSNSLEGVLDFYILTHGPQSERIWPRVSYHEAEIEGHNLRAKIARMSLEKFVQAARGASLDTTIWARFVQPSALIWHSDERARMQVVEAVASAAASAARLAAALGPSRGQESEFWRALFRATYRAEFRVEAPGREEAILSANGAHFDGLLPLAWRQAGIAFDVTDTHLAPQLSHRERRKVLRWWTWRRRLGKPLNIVRLLKASATFEGAARYAAWKIERHSGIAVKITPWREAHPLLAAPGVLWHVWRERRRMRDGPRRAPR